MDTRVLLFLMGVSAVLVESKPPKCLDTDTKKIADYWSEHGGPPKDILKSTDTYRVIKGTNSKATSETKCKHITFTSGNTMNIKEDNSSTPISEKDGVLSMTDTSCYIMTFGDGVLTNYKCSASGDAVTEDNVPDICLAATDAAKAEDITKAEEALKTLGYPISSYNCQ